ncbi:hypothetical protein AciX9_4139 (plasmid) [Granulicella tundricola MP5ACTX9]|uniref:Uncharacterized protein n=1 Tax=Granulicella tundricola (strain ATCC BAA-1859 / DSM 23138 / MP5ACTX9) TaxID=1198114 RepID=E8X635_GRATM|nr:hypothetical protein AciX9_4139 [Granulicella tundricola MP5ACTX9]
MRRELSAGKNEGFTPTRVRGPKVFKANDLGLDFRLQTDHAPPAKREVLGCSETARNRTPEAPAVPLFAGELQALIRSS